MIDAHNTCVKVLKPAHSKGELVKLLVDSKRIALEIIFKKSQKLVVPLRTKAYPVICLFLLLQTSNSLSTDNYLQNVN